MRKRVFCVALGALLLTLCFSVEAQQPKERRIAVIGAPEEPRFSEVVAGLKNGLDELGYAKSPLVVKEVRIARSEENRVKSVVEGLLREQAQVLVLISSRLLKSVERHRLMCRWFSSRQATRWPPAWSKVSPIRGAIPPR
jgi:ABC-type uncharacterized transport system substrate-binding protein